jgi:glucosamine--fructose-6-phosphate aminotransferase (isomerizing)
MCGIIGYICPRETTKVLIEGLKRLEYRGYDSAGIAVFQGEKIEIRRRAGKLNRLEELIEQEAFDGRVGIGHTRWATHGKPSDENAHPHKAGKVAVVHNGIIENYLPLKEFLTSKGHVFSSETDTEIVAHLIDECIREGHSFPKAVRMTLEKVKILCLVLCGAAEMFDQCQKAPLVIGLGRVPNTQRPPFFPADLSFHGGWRHRSAFFQRSPASREGEGFPEPNLATILAGKECYKHFMLRRSLSNRGL